MSWHRLFPLAELGVGQMRSLRVLEDPIALCRVTEREVYAIEDLCSHDGAPLCSGGLTGAAVECPRHGARFDVRDGRVLRMPAVAPLLTYPVRLSDDGFVEVEVEDA